MQNMWARENPEGKTVTTFEVHLIDKYTGAVERSLPVDTWLEAQLIARRADHDKYTTRITEQETK
ncbi:hypothetical protein [uncultured Corynebacterium sp.]|uniref:hypothetical protein n=1 Tax=uncultured Corynebacterium sp. TaxID=159447 RepID=UPI002593387D|nr:hypothetical protein [uncultured Corynebacterium sp.]